MHTIVWLINKELIPCHIVFLMQYTNIKCFIVLYLWPYHFGVVEDIDKMCVLIPNVLVKAYLDIISA